MADQQSQYNDEGFLTVPNRPITDDFAASASASSPYTGRTLEPPKIVPARISQNTITDVVSLTYFANASAGDQVVTVSLNLPSKPLGFVWSMGAVDKLGVVVDDGVGLVEMGDTYALLPTIVFGGTAGAKWNKDELKIRIRSTNIGYAVFVTAYFKYVFFYDDVDVSQFGL